MPTCPNCSYSIDEGTQYCSYCNAPNPASGSLIVTPPPPQTSTKLEKLKTGFLMTVGTLLVGGLISIFLSRVIGGAIVVVGFALLLGLIRLLAREETSQEKLAERAQLDTLSKGGGYYPRIEKYKQRVAEAEKTGNADAISKAHLSLAADGYFIGYYRSRKAGGHINVGDISLLQSSKTEFEWVMKNSPSSKHRSQAEKGLKALQSDVDRIRRDALKIVTGESPCVEGLNASEYLARINTAFPESG